MSQETSRWLNTWILIGQTEKRGHAWHWKAEEQGDQSNHYPGFIPVEDVKERLFAWEPIAMRPNLKYLAAPGEIQGMPDGGVFELVDQQHKAMVRPPGVLGPDDKGGVFGFFGKESYQAHSYQEWLVNKVAQLLHGDIGITSAGLLREGAVAFVEVSVPETIETPEGVRFRPNILAATSLDGSLASVYKRTITNTVCDNTMSAALGEYGPQVKVRHSRYSNLKINEAATALELIYTTSDEFSAKVAELCNTTVTDKQWNDFLDRLSPIPKDEGRGRTLAESKQALLRRMYEIDDRCAPWKGTAYGVLQTVNTWYHHEQTILKGANRAERNMTRAIRNNIEKLDGEVYDLLMS